MLFKSSSLFLTFKLVSSIVTNLESPSENFNNTGFVSLRGVSSAIATDKLMLTIVKAMIT